MKIGFVGGGNMAEAMLSSILTRGISGLDEIRISDTLPARRDYLQSQYRVSVTPDNPVACQGRDIVILAVKPQVLNDVMAGLKNQLTAEQLVISIIAGKSINTLSLGLGHSCIVRSMPNTPAQIGEGMTVWTSTPSVTARQRSYAASILGAMGLEIEVDDEKYLDMATAVSGSGPAYLFLFVESMIEAAVKLGFTAETAQKLVMQTLLGSAHLLHKSGRTPQELRRMVTSPGGTTAEAIATFEKGGFTQLIAEAVKAAHLKAQKLGS
ncbi:MAG TPA: pyrroline-5-carboxylate reductase [Dehalococcoidales bacterium]|nr:pyrroline-5-carboxylate reductase [Dehalococcoidales bacterium]